MSNFDHADWTRALVDKSIDYEIDMIVAWLFLFLVHVINFPKNFNENGCQKLSVLL